MKVGYNEFQRNVLSLANSSARDVAGNKHLVLRLKNKIWIHHHTFNFRINKQFILPP